MPCAPLPTLGGLGRTRCGGIHFLVHRDWNCRDVRSSMAGMCDYVKNCVSFIMYLVI